MVVRVGVQSWFKVVKRCFTCACIYVYSYVDACLWHACLSLYVDWTPYLDVYLYSYVYVYSLLVVSFAFAILSIACILSIFPSVSF